MESDGTQGLISFPVMQSVYLRQAHAHSHAVFLCLLCLQQIVNPVIPVILRISYQSSAPHTRTLPEIAPQVANNVIESRTALLQSTLDPSSHRMLNTKGKAVTTTAAILNSNTSSADTQVPTITHANAAPNLISMRECSSVKASTVSHRRIFAASTIPEPHPIAVSMHGF